MNIEIVLPDWAVEKIAQLPDAIEDVESRMRTVIEFSRINFEQDTGGPFAAGVFEKESGRIVAIGVNLVVPSGISSAHAEIVTLSLAQLETGEFDLGAPGLPHHQLVVNAQPCAMCFGSIPWSGIRSLVFAASGNDVEEITGFDEGPVHPEWRKELQQRGIEVADGLLAEEARQVFRDFSTSGRPVYNGRSG
ncbi:MAG: nucleoside deaminase [Planctomycetota bacterium]